MTDSERLELLLNLTRAPPARVREAHGGDAARIRLGATGEAGLLKGRDGHGYRRLQKAKVGDELAYRTATLVVSRVGKGHEHHVGEDTVALAHSSMMSDILRGVQRHRGMPAVMLRQTPVTMRLTSLTPASVREQQTLLRSDRPMRRSMRPSSERCPALCVMVGLSTPWCSAISKVRSGLPTFARWHMMPSSSNVTRPEAGVDWRTRPKARRTDRYSHTFNDKTPEKQRTSSSLGYL